MTFSLFLFTYVYFYINLSLCYSNLHYLIYLSIYLRFLHYVTFAFSYGTKWLISTMHTKYHKQFRNKEHNLLKITCWIYIQQTQTTSFPSSLQGLSLPASFLKSKCDDFDYMFPLAHKTGHCIWDIVTSLIFKFMILLMIKSM